MKKYYYFLFLLTCFITNGQENIFFSEYAEGSSNNKYLEIYNNSDQTIDLNEYAFPNVSNAPTTVGEYEYWNTFDAGSTIEPYGIFVIAHPSADETILAEADMTSFVYFSNGDDGFKLVYGTEESFTVLDEIGDWQGDPGAGWDVAGVSQGTKDHTLVRKSSVQNGNTWANSAGTNADDSEWIVYDQNTWTYLGAHEIDSSLSISDNEILDMMVYPNPVDGNYVTIISPVEGLKEIQVFTVTGRKVMDTNINGNTLDVSSFNSGFYMLKVTINGQSKISKVVVR